MGATRAPNTSPPGTVVGEVRNSPPGTVVGESSKRRRRRKRTRLATTLRRINGAARARHVAYSDGAHPNETEKLTRELDGLYGDLRGQRRDLYRVAPMLEGRPVHRGDPARKVAR